MIEVLKQALDALETEVSIDWTNNDEFNASAEKMHDAITSLQQAIAEAEKQEQPLPTVEIGVDVTAEGASVVGFYRRPNAVMEMFYSQFHPAPQLEQNFCSRCGKRTNDIHTCTPPQRSESSGKPSAWVGLTDEEVDDAARYCVKSGQSVNAAIRAIEAKLKEKNT